MGHPGRGHHNEASAHGRLRVSARGAGADAGARIGITARASLSDAAATAALFIEALTNGASRVSVVADRFAIVGGTAATPLRSVPFYVQGGAVYMDTAHIRNATIDSLHLASGAVVAGHASTLSGARKSWNTWAEIARFTVNLPEACRGIVLFCCTDITRHGSTALAHADLQLDAVNIRNGRSSVGMVSNPGPGADPAPKTLADNTRALNPAAGNNVFRLRGINIGAVSYRPGVPAFKR